MASFVKTEEYPQHGSTGKCTQKIFKFVLQTMSFMSVIRAMMFYVSIRLY